MDLLSALTLMYILGLQAFCNHFITTHMVLGKLLAAGANALCLICKTPAADHFVFELDVYQLVFQLGWVSL